MNRKGFTLVELSIVLVIIGLLIGGVLKGKAMIENAKVKRVKSDSDGIVAATYGYQDKFGYLPGDDPSTTAICQGNGDGLINGGAENLCFWKQLIDAGFISGDASLSSETTIAKRHPFGGRYLIRYDGATGKNYIYVDNIPSDVATSLDIKYDDGKANSGDYQQQGASAATYSAGNVDMRLYIMD